MVIRLHILLVAPLLLRRLILMTIFGGYGAYWYWWLMIIDSHNDDWWLSMAIWWSTMMVILFKKPLIVFVESDYILYQSLLNFAVASPGLRPNETNHATAVYLRLWILPSLVSTPVAEYSEYFFSILKYKALNSTVLIPLLVLLSTVEENTQTSCIEAERGPGSSTEMNRRGQPLNVWGLECFSNYTLHKQISA